tara:strand:- start:1073 stop:1519 length:447 start_codon:yes stop_codon:yes gene_type:complete
VARKRTTFRFPIDSNFRADWEDFIKHAETKRQTPSQLLQDIVLDYLDDEAHEKETSQRKKIVKSVIKKKGKKPPIVKKSAPPRPSSNKKPDKFLVLELLQDLDDGDGVEPDELIFEAEDEGIYDPEGELRKLIRRGLVYLHEGRCRSK